jgi:hypothetical protein
MNLKLLVALLSAGILALLGGTAVVAALPTGTAGAKAPHFASAPLPPSSSARALEHKSSVKPGGSTGSVPAGRPNQPTTTSTARTDPASTTRSTDFVLVTITYAVKKGDTLASIAEWFTQHGYGVQYDANLQVIDSNKNLIVPGALISISNGVMTIQSPV